MPILSARCPALAGCVLLAAACAVNPRIEEAKRIVDRAEPLRCEILAMEGELARAAAGSAASTRLRGEIAQAKAALKWHYLATMDEYIAVMKTLPFEDRKSIYRYSERVAERCAGGTGAAP